jgi:class 3 adenylate cyclase/tetratricopeptide (TPR) repeat protein
LVRRCQWCAEIVDARANYCSRCGHKLPLASSEQGRALPSHADVSAVPAAGSGLSAFGELKQVTVLFADVVESTAMIRDMELERSVEVLDPLVRGMAKAVQNQGGLVAGLMGDGMKGIFGAPIAQVDHAERACAAALEIRDSSENRAKVRIGINSGEVVMRALEFGADGDYDAMGLPVHIAARLQQLAQPGRICLSASTAHLVKNRFHIRRLGLATPKGMVQPIEMFELVRRRHARSRWEGRESHGLTRLVGRDAQLRLMQEKLDQALGGNSQFIAVSGEAGVGKSRLVYELLRQNDLDAWTVLTTSATADDHRSSFRPFAAMLRTWLGIEPTDSPARIRAAVNDHLSVLGEIGPEGRHSISVLLDMPAEETPPDDRARDLRTTIMSGMLDLIRQCARAHPTLLIVEDVHWLDRDSVELLAMLEANLRGMPVAMVVTCRPEALPLATERLESTIISLPRLSSNDALRILETRLGDDASLSPVKDHLVSRAQGIPLFLEEMARSLIEDGTLLQQSGRFRLAGKSRSFVLPETIRGLLAERIDRLTGRRKEIVQFASAVGREVPVKLLYRLMRCANGELDADLNALATSGLAQLLNEGSEPRLAFNHVLTQEVAYAGLLQQQRRYIHASIIEAFEYLYAERLDEHVETLADHAERARLWIKAAEYLLRAARRSIERSGHTQAVQLLKAALKALGPADLDVRGKEQLELELRLLLRVAFNAIGNYRERLDNLDRAQVLAESTGRKSLLPTLMVSRASVMLQLGRVAGAIDLCATALRSAGRRRDDETRVIAAYMLSRSQFYNGQFRQSVTSAQKAIELVRKEPAKFRHGGGFGSSEVMILTQMAQSQACLGLFAEATANSEAAIAAAERLARNFDIGLASYGFGMVHLYSATLQRSVATLERGLHAVETTGAAQSIFAILAGLLSYAYLRAGAADQALHLCRRVLAFDEESHHHANWSRLYGAMIFRETGHVGEALPLAKRASQVARKGGYVVQIAWSDLLLAKFHEVNSPSQALAHLRRATRLCEDIQLRPCLVRSLVQSSEICRKQNQIDLARELAERAEQVARSIDMATHSID